MLMMPLSSAIVRFVSGGGLCHCCCCCCCCCVMPFCGYTRFIRSPFVCMCTYSLHMVQSVSRIFYDEISFIWTGFYVFDVDSMNRRLAKPKRYVKPWSEKYAHAYIKILAEEFYWFRFHCALWLLLFGSFSLLRFCTSIIMYCTSYLSQFTEFAVEWKYL